MRRHIAFLRRDSLVRLDAVSSTLTLLDYLRLDERAILRKALTEIDGAASPSRARPGSGGARADRPHRSRSRAQSTERRRGAHCGRHLQASATCSACPTPRSPSRCEGWIARSAGRFPRRAVRRPQSRSHDLPVEGDRRAAADARDFGVRRNRRRHPQMGTGAAGTARRPGDPGIDLACVRGVGAALNPL
jgi:hypothetical protein